MAYAPNQFGPPGAGDPRNRPAHPNDPGFWGDLDYPGSDLQRTGPGGSWTERSYWQGYRLGNPNGGPDFGSGWEFAGRGAYGDRVNWGPGANPPGGFPDGSGAQPSYRGVGSRHYQRSNERIVEDVHERFYEDPFLNARDVEVQVENGIVTLTGQVPDRRQKRHATDLAELVPGVSDVHNLIQVTSG